jgi:citrate lyase subunit beta/citryl-CoA lyase
VIIDLEDGVAPHDKRSARAAVAQWLSAAHPVVVRVNGAASEWFHDDLALCAAPGVSAVMLPKAEDAEQVRAVVRRTAPGVALLPLIESARGFAHALDIAGCAGVQRLAFGSLDFQADLGISGDDDALLYFRSQLVLVSRLAELPPPIDGVTTAIDDLDQVRAHAARARRLGFGGTLCIHPRQVPIVNECFQPTPEELAWATKVMKAATASGGGAVAVDGRMLDRPVMLQAERILSETERGAQHAGHAQPESIEEQG